ncbi:alpha/beta fold hydrolase [Oceanobacter mangrovi]|uniref:alpha/beta fold hydrolase n=1 Tax=Oceanobacter mangrovi TaxID=2862510 RepID=UPI001C8DF667|nr:alpha/beta fold hydrolase [Oceanobacter mangrovi]
MQAPHSSSASTATSTSGKAPTSKPERVCVLLRGLIRSRFHWHQFPTELLKLPLVEQVIMPELAGNGERCRETTPATINAMMEDLRQQTRLLFPDNSHPLSLVAISMGAMIATEWASQYPEEIAELHLINTSFGRFSAPWQRMRPRAAARLLGLTPRLLSDPAALEAGILQLTVSQPTTPQLRSQWQSFARQNPLQTSNILTQIKAASRWQGPAQAPVEHSFIYTADGDRLVSPDCSRQIAAHWHKPLIEHPHAGHDLPLDDCHWLVQSIERTMQSW